MTVRTYLSQLQYEIYNTPDPTYMKVDEVKVDMKNSYVKRMRSSSSYFVNVEASIDAKCKRETFFEVEVEYSALVVFEGDITTVAEFNRIVEDDVPRRLYEHIRGLVWNLSSESGLPPVMLKSYDEVKQDSNSSDDTEEKKNDIDTKGPTLFDMINEEDNDDKESEEENVDDFEDDNIQCIEHNDCDKLSYEWLFNEFLKNKQTVDFFNSLRVFDKSDLSVYQNLMVYKYYLRFIKPIEYHHPKNKKCDYSLWPMLLQMLFAVGKNVEIVSRKGKLPEIEFDFSENERRTVSSLKLHELKKLLLELGTEVFVRVFSDMVYMDVDREYADNLRSDNSILKEEIMNMFRVGEYETDERVLRLVDTMFNNIRRYDLQILPYTL